MCAEFVFGFSRIALFPIPHLASHFFRSITLPGIHASIVHMREFRSDAMCGQRQMDDRQRTVASCDSLLDAIVHLHYTNVAGINEINEIGRCENILITVIRYLSDAVCPASGMRHDNENYSADQSHCIIHMKYT